MQQFDNHTYHSYLSLQATFNQEYKVINRQIIELYQQPKKFIEENEKRIKAFIKNQPNEVIPGNAELSYKGLRDFGFELEDFKLQAMQLFFEHRSYIDKCTAFVLKINEMKAKYGDNPPAACGVEYIEFIPELHGLRMGVKDLHEKAHDMVKRLERIKERWNRINS